MQGSWSLARNCAVTFATWYNCLSTCGLAVLWPCLHSSTYRCLEDRVDELENR